MSFSSDVKQELIRKPLLKDCCVLAELGALTQCTASVIVKGGGVICLEYRLQNMRLAQRVLMLLKNVLHAMPEIRYMKAKQFGTHTVCILTVGERYAPVLLGALQMMQNTEKGFYNFHFTMSKSVFTRRCCQSAYIRGMFLGCGTMRTPKDGYYMSFFTGTSSKTKQLRTILRQQRIYPGISTRNDKSVLFLNAGEDLSKCLAFMGATQAVLTVENARIRREVLNQANRAANCDKANLNRQVSNALRETEVIRAYREKYGLTALQDDLSNAALVRLEYPDASYAQLGEIMHISKSGVYHRMKRLIEIIDRTENEGKG